MEIITTDKFGNELCVGDTICFTLSMRIDSKPIVRATITGIQNDWLIIDYIESPDVAWGRKEKKLHKKVSAHRVVKCY